MPKYSFLENIFSVKNELECKILTILGFKFRFTNKKLQIKQEYAKKFENMQIRIEDLQRNIENMSKKVTPKRKLTNFEIHLTEHCNLNCQCCNHYSPLAEPEYADLDRTEKDFCRISELTGGDVDFINLLGGEPLLHPDLLGFFDLTRKYFPNTKINLVSNGILLAVQKDDFWQRCKDKDITVCVTKYPLNIDWGKIDNRAKKYGIEIFYWNNNDILKHSWHFPIDLSGTQDMAKNFLNCQDSNSCIFLRDGKLFTCVVPPNIHHFNKFFNQNIEVCKQDYIDIYEAKNIDEILRFLATPIPFCRYCKVKDRKFDLPWKRSQKTIQEWV